MALEAFLGPRWPQEPAKVSIPHCLLCQFRISIFCMFWKCLCFFILYLYFIFIRLWQALGMVVEAFLKVLVRFLGCLGVSWGGLGGVLGGLGRVLGGSWGGLGTKACRNHPGTTPRTATSAARWRPRWSKLDPSWDQKPLRILSGGLLKSDHIFDWLWGRVCCHLVPTWVQLGR